MQGGPATTQSKQRTLGRDSWKQVRVWAPVFSICSRRIEAHFVYCFDRLRLLAFSNIHLLLYVGKPKGKKIPQKKRKQNGEATGA